MTFGEFWRKYKVLSESSNTLSENLGVEQVKSAVQDLLEELDLDKTAVRLGNTQVSVYRFHLLRCLSYNWKTYNPFLIMHIRNQIQKR